MMRNYTNINKYIDKLYSDIYPQPPDDGHTSWAIESIYTIFTFISGNLKNILDVGCGEGFCQEIFESYGLKYHGVAFGEDVIKAQKNGLNVVEMDFSFLDYQDNSFDILYSRHSLEHSPMPLLTLMEWYRVTKKYLVVILPDPTYWGYSGRNHYYVLNREQWINLFKVSGFRVVVEEEKRQVMETKEDAPEVTIEFWFLLEKIK